MINQDNILKMYEGIINKKDLTTKNLKSYGFNSNDLSKLITDKILKRIKRGHYCFLGVNDLYCYGKQLIDIKEYDKADACFLECYKLKPNHNGVCIYLFAKYIKSDEYEKALTYFQKFYNSDNIFYNVDNNFYLYLLNIITELPPKYKEIANLTNFNDIKIYSNDKRYSDVSLYNNIRKDALEHNFSEALDQLNILINLKGRISIIDIVTKTLLSKIIEKEKYNRCIILDLLQDKKYEEIILFIKNLSIKNNDLEYYILILINDLLKLKKFENIPQTKILTDNMFEAIIEHDYALALDILNNKKKNSDFDVNDKIIYILLKDINDIMLLFKNFENNNVDNMQNLNMSLRINVIHIINALRINNLNTAFDLLNKYLETIDKKQYLFLMIDLIKLGWLEQDWKFIKLRNVLENISKSNFAIKIPTYTKQFYNMYSKNRLQEARIYLDIASKLNDINPEFDYAILLDQALNNKSNHIKNENPEEKVDANINNFNCLFNKETIYKSNGNEKIDYLYEKLNILYQKGIVLLEDMPYADSMEICNIIRKIPDVTLFEINYQKSRRIALKYKIPCEKINISQIINLGNQAYEDCNYDLCIKLFRKLLESGVNNSFIYARLGLAYMKKNDITTAIDYLTVATFLSKQSNTDYDFSELVNKLQQSHQNYLKSDINNFYGIDNIEQMATLISQGDNLWDVFTKFNLNNEQIGITLLIFARECYYQENYNLGDQYLKQATKLKNKTKLVLQLLNEVIKNKKFYKNRLSKEHKVLSLTKIKK